MPSSSSVPQYVKTWFVIHFVADLLFAVPLLITPVATLKLFGWSTIDPVATRLVAAAFFAIGTTSLLARDADQSSYRSLLMLKLLWSSMALLGLLFNLASGAPSFTWIAVAIFFVFFLVWAFSYQRIRKQI